MYFDPQSRRLQLSATDLASFLSCHHKAALDMSHAFGKIEKPQYDDPSLESLFARGLEHEANYVEQIEREGRAITRIEKGATRDVTMARTLEAMKAGADVIVQGALGVTAPGGELRWFGYSDVLLKVATPSVFGAWSYEVVDTKLSRETKAGTVLQLTLYSTMLERWQKVRPERFYVVTPDATETYRLDDYAAYFRLVQSRLDDATTSEDGVEKDEVLAAANYPEPVDHCDICAWTGQCRAQRRTDDHLSLVAGIARTQRRELVSHDIAKTAELAAMPIQPMTFRPKRGAAETYERVREQARVQVQARDTGELVVEMLPVVLPTEKEPGQGLCRLPEPTAGDIFLDLEGDPFAGPATGTPNLRGREYLFGVVTIGQGGATNYQAFWAATADEERLAFERVVDLIMSTKAQWPGMHVFHYAPYEPSAFKRLMGRHATREIEIDSLLRSETFVDLYAVVRQSLRAGVERYSIKNLEPFYSFTRDIDLRLARRHLQAMELAVEQNRVADLKPEVCAAVEGYNRDDCVSTLHLRNWLEENRAGIIAAGGEVPRPASPDGGASEALDQKQQQAAALRGQLLGAEGDSRRILAYLLDWHRREAKSAWWEYFRLIDLSDDDLLDESAAVSGLEYLDDVGREKKSVIQRYAYPPQEMELRRGDELKTKDKKSWAQVVDLDRQHRTIDVLVGPSKLSVRPTAAFAHKQVSAKAMEDAIFAIGEGVISGTADVLAVNLLNRVPPRTRNVVDLNGDVLAVQGPPGAGKTYTGGNMICDLVAAGKKVGIAATSHKVIRNLLNAVAKEATKRHVTVKLAHKGGDDTSEVEGDVEIATVQIVASNEEALALLSGGDANVLGGTAWLWSRPEFSKSVDVLFIDEAGQVALANALAMTQAATSLVLLGDPQQLDQPKKGSHPDGVDASVLEHILGEHQTMPEAQGIFLGETWRFGAPICDFTSEVFYENKLRPTTRKRLDRLRLLGSQLPGNSSGIEAGLFVAEVSHEGNRNGSDEEVARVIALVAQLTRADSQWVDADDVARPMTTNEILVVSPYNVHVSRLQEALPGVRCGTVDKFQGQEAPVVIYSMATSSPEDAPRGMEFLYSLNRLNVATSRAQCAAIIVASPKLFEPECKTPRQIQLANGLCRFWEMARVIA